MHKECVRDMRSELNIKWDKEVRNTKMNNDMKGKCTNINESIENKKREQT